MGVYGPNVDLKGLFAWAFVGMVLTVVIVIAGLVSAAVWAWSHVAIR